jgi:signal transduction histidine kinase
VDRKDILAKLTRAHDDIGQVVDAMVGGNQARLSWTRLLAHNVNNHLTSVFFIIERFTQESEMSPETQATYVEGLKDVADRIQETMRRLMMVSQCDSLVRVAPVDLSQAVSEAVARHQGYASLKSMRLEVTGLAGATPIIVNADRLGLIESLLNLIGNAIKYSPPGKRISVTVEPVGAEVEIRVRDQGPGIGSRDQANLFKTGGVLSTKPTGGEPQTGIGLAMTHELVEAMGGTVWCQSEPGKGAMFGIRLPLAKPAQKGASSAE